jgi:glutamate synthase (NADPH/NADH) large chain
MFLPRRLPALFDLDAGEGALESAVERLCQQAVEAVDDGCGLLILSDRGVDARRAPIPALLALSAVHQRLTRDGIRMQTGLLVETGEAREVHDFAALFGFGAAAVNPYLALDTVRALADSGEIAVDETEAQARYVKAVEEGLLKVMSKMGISTLQSYRGAQIFEAVGLDRAVIDRHFTGTPSRLGGVGFAELQREARERHARGYGPAAGPALPIGGLYQWRRQGEQHRWNPQTVALLQAAVQGADRDAFRKFSAAADDETRGGGTLRALLELVPAKEPIPLEEVESLESIVRRFVTGAMSFGSISA